MQNRLVLVAFIFFGGIVAASAQESLNTPTCNNAIAKRCLYDGAAYSAGSWICVAKNYAQQCKCDGTWAQTTASDFCPDNAAGHAPPSTIRLLHLQSEHTPQ
jgi:hypothetical protein